MSSMWLLAGLLWLVSVSQAWQVQSLVSIRTTRNDRSAFSSCPLFPTRRTILPEQLPHSQSSHRLFLSTEDTSDSKEQAQSEPAAADFNSAALSSATSSTDISATPGDSQALRDALQQNKDSRSSEGGLTRTFVLAVPLFCKFIIVLVIKFLTDLVVFPLLFLYRAARLLKRSIVRTIFSRGNKKGNDTNGDSNFGNQVNGAKGN
jgi:hypothetical protein